MRNWRFILSLAVAAVVAVFVLLPILGLLLLAAAALVGILLMAPLLARLPWFRDRIIVHRYTGGRGVRYGREDEPLRKDHGRLGDSDVIDVEGREVPDRE